MEYKGKLSVPVKIGYGLGTVGDSVPYNLFFTYFLFYLTDVAGISPAVAGVISFISILWDAVTDPVVGYMSDKSKNPKGRRRPWMFRSIWPLSIVIVLLFMPNSFGGSAQVAYYVIVAVCLWTFYTTYTVPWGALGAEITQDYNERNTTRMYIGVIAYVFVALCNSGPMYVISFLTPKGFDVKDCWGIVGAIAAVIIVVLGLISWRSTKGHELEVVPDATPSTGSVFKGFFTQYGQLFKIKIFIILIVVGFIYLIGFTIFNSVGVYMLTYCAELSPGQQGTFWVIYTVAAMVCTPIPILVANKIGKKPALISFSMFFVVNTIAFYFIGVGSFTLVIIYACLVALSTSAFWGLYFSFVYDVAEVDHYINGKRREGGILALAQFFQKFGGAVATSLTGALLSVFGYTGMGAESPETVNGILMLATIIPGAIVLVSMLIMTRFPLNKKKFDAIKEATKAKEEGKEVNEDAFKDCL